MVEGPAAACPTTTVARAARTWFGEDQGACRRSPPHTEADFLTRQDKLAALPYFSFPHAPQQQWALDDTTRRFVASTARRACLGLPSDWKCGQELATRRWTAWCLATQRPVPFVGLEPRDTQLQVMSDITFLFLQRLRGDTIRKYVNTALFTMR